MTKKKLKLPLLLALTLALLVVTVPFAFAGDGDAAAAEPMKGMQQEQAPNQMDQMDQQQDMQAMHEQMMQRHQQMLDEMKQEEAKLDSLVEQMQSAQGDAKVDAIAAVLQELVAQHQERMGQRIEMMEKMGGMMGHGMPGMHHGGKKMMKGHAGHCGSCAAHEKSGDCPMHGKGMKCDDCPMKDRHEVRLSHAREVRELPDAPADDGPRRAAGGRGHVLRRPLRQQEVAPTAAEGAVSPPPRRVVSGRCRLCAESPMARPVCTQESTS